MKKVLFHSFRVLLVLGLLLVAQPVHPAQAVLVNRYVSQSGEDVGNCATTSCLTIAYAVSQAVDGNSIIIDEGLYPTTLSLTKNLNFYGQGRDITIISAGDASRVIDVPTASYTVSFTDLTIANGYVDDGPGGGISNRGTMTLLRVNVNQNSALDGGGIFTMGSMTITDSEISDNYATADPNGYGGGIFIAPTSGKTVTLDRVTLSGNSAVSSGGAIHSQGASGSSTFLINVTISDNSAAQGGGISHTTGSTLSIVNSTIADNYTTGGAPSGGINSYGAITFKNTLIAANTPANCGTGTGGVLTSQGYNLDSGNTCNFSLTSDLPNNDPRIAPLADNGGYTRTRALNHASILYPASPAIDAGTETGCPAVDQRGLERPYGFSCDIGAYEYTEFTISGNAGIPNAKLSYTDLDPKIATADGAGFYTFTVPSYWSGVVTPSLNGYKFTPNHKDYVNVWIDKPGQNYVYSNPIPVLSSIYPDNKWAGKPGLTLILFGTKFTPESVVRWNVSDRVTTFVNPGKLTAAITAADLATASIASVTVFNPTPGGGLSVTKAFTVKNDVPVILFISPASKLHGKPSFTLIVFGSKFGTGAKVRWNTSNRPTTFVNSGKLTATIYAADIATAGTASVRVFNPAPMGGLSNASTFTIQ
jgi:predicted outer membrane repeat protein